MVERTRELELALGCSSKFVAENERDTVVVQRRCLRAVRDLAAGTVLREEMLEALRPAPRDAVFPFELPRVVGEKLTCDVAAGECLKWTSLVEVRK
jgi:sialic acid synthase SpsE